MSFVIYKIKKITGKRLNLNIKFYGGKYLLFFEPSHEMSDATFYCFKSKSLLD